jgi:hypothetical protein
MTLPAGAGELERVGQRRIKHEPASPSVLRRTLGGSAKVGRTPAEGAALAAIA